MTDATTATKPLNIFRTTLLFVLFFELLSYFSYALNIFGDFSSLIFILITLATLVLSIRKIEWGIGIALVELLIGSHGHLFQLTINNTHVSIRIGIFCIVMLAWIIWLVRQQTLTPLVSFAKNNKPLPALGIVWLIGLAMAFFQQNSAVYIYCDANSWLYFFYALPVLTIVSSSPIVRSMGLNKNIEKIFLACVSYISVKSIVMLYLFSHNVPWLIEIYKWGRDTGWGEFTPLAENYYRVFSQSHIFALLSTVFLIGLMIFNNRKQYYSLGYGTDKIIILALTITTVFLSLSRTFWLALSASVAIMLVYALISRQIAIKRLLFIIGQLAILCAISYGIMFGATNLPWPKVSAKPTNLSSRMQFDSSASTRTNELLPLLKSIAKHPIIGSGWGAAVTFTSADLRFIANNPNGQRATYAFEWGYLDIILKIGLLGFFAYLFLIWSIAKKLYQAHKKNADWALPLLFCLIALLIVHALTPYLNVPLGIGVILLLMVATNQESRQQNFDDRLQNR